MNELIFVEPSATEKGVLALWEIYTVQEYSLLHRLHMERNKQLCFGKQSNDKISSVECVRSEESREGERV